MGVDHFAMRTLTYIPFRSPRPRSPRPPRRRAGGGVLLEILVSIAIFITAATFSLRAVSSVITGLDRSRREAYAVDLVRSKMAELEAGLITISDLQGESDEAVGSMREAGFESEETSAYADLADMQWVFEVTTTRSEFPGLSLVELTVTEEPLVETGDDSRLISFTLRQLMPLREEDEEDYEMDEMLEGLPGIDGGTGFPGVQP